MGRKNRGTTHISDSDHHKDQQSDPPASLGLSKTVNGVSRQNLIVSEGLGVRS